MLTSLYPNSVTAHDFYSLSYELRIWFTQVAPDPQSHCTDFLHRLFTRVYFFKTNTVSRIFLAAAPKSSKKTYLFTFGTLKAQAHVALKIKIIDIKYVSISSKYVHTYTHINIFCTQLKSREGIKDMKCLLKTCVKQINHILILQVSQQCVKKNIEQNVSDYFNVMMTFS